jgi:hypothetical protein
MIQEVLFNSLSRYSAQPRPAHLPADDCTDNNPRIEAAEGSLDYEKAPSSIVAGQMCDGKKYSDEKSEDDRGDGSSHYRADTYCYTVEDHADFLRHAEWRDVHDEDSAREPMGGQGRPGFPCAPVVKGSCSHRQGEAKKTGQAPSLRQR